MIDLLTKDEQGTGYTPRPRKPRRKLSKLERLRLAIVAHMREQRKAVTKWAAAQTTLPYSFPDWNHFKLGALKMTERMTPIISAIWDASGTKFASRVGLDPNQWSVANPHTAHRIEHAALAFCEETNKSTSTDIQTALDRLRVHLHEGIVNEGESVEQLTKRVQAVFDTATKSRARTIAQTETSRAVHAAQDDAAHKSGVVTGWRWLLSSDACPVCVAIAARNPTVQLGQPFAIIGKNPNYSHVFMPPAHVNCNCTAQEILDIDVQPTFSVAPLFDPEAATEQELQSIRQQRHERDEAILRGSEAWGAAPYVERYPTGRPLPQKPPKRIRKLAKSFDEAQHPRDELGRFAASGHSFTSHEEAHRWASLTFPNANVETTGIHHETWSKIARVVHSVLSKFPGIAERVRSFGAEEMHPSLIAAATVGGSRSLNFNTLWWGNPNKLDAALKINVRDGYNPPGVEHAGIEYYVSHEMGHLIDGYMEEKAPAVWKALQRQITLPLKPGRRIADLDRDAASKVSQYAATSTQEAFAEAYAASRYQKSPTNSIVQAFGSLIP